ncbi:nuclear transport factor 2 family protein [Nocardia sp. NPDC047654]|uniref:nuclear transport factor 2 family protein n=1 Tax=Nocardia sp. NPDC047654 TaxID=3364314 RepID=UPI003710B593
MSDTIAEFRRATESGDIDALTRVLAPDAELISPLSGRLVFRGRDDLRVLLSAAYGSLTGLRWTEEIGDGARRVLLAAATIGPFRLTEALVLGLDEQGRVRTLQPHLRPWPALTYLAVRLAPRLFRNLGAVRRAAQAA